MFSAGSLAVSAGAAMIYRPAGLIVAGAILIVVALRIVSAPRIDPNA